MFEKAYSLASPVVSVPALLLIFAFVLEWVCDVGRLKGKSKLLGASEDEWFPRLKAHFRYCADGFNIIYDTIDEKTDQIYQIPFAGKRHYILPARYIQELRSLPQHTVNSSGGIAEYFLGNFTSLHAVNALGHTTWQTIRLNMTSDQKLGLMVDKLIQTCQDTMRDALGVGQGWRTLTARPALLDIIVKMNGPVLVGEELFKKSDWADICSSYAQSIFPMAIYLKMFPAFLHPIIGPLFPLWWRIQSLRRRARKTLSAEVTARLNEDQDEKIARKRDSQEDMIDWLLQQSGDARQPQDVINRQLGISFAAIHTSAVVIVKIMFALAERWDEYAPALIEELEQAITENGGEVRMDTVNKLAKLDSFMKEVFRHSPFTAISFQRQLLKDHVLSDGTLLPKGSQIAMASGPLSMSPSVYEEPNEFRGFRFATPRGQPDGPKVELYTNSGVHGMLFGHGRWACPGRFFAALGGKIILMHVLANYELRLPGGRMSPREKFADLQNLVPAAELEIRKRKPSAQLAALELQ
ncbi:cytochrome p450 [Pyrenophora tritici-repentis]|nr:cytochrome p450 [Pyrenophora tritici-repentis]KAI2484404.1 cytochrome p450 [Pyrenophora tritici-repentis]